MTGAANPESSVILGAGYAGLATWHAARSRAGRRWPVVLVDRHPVHVVRTELYKVGKIAAKEGAVSAWALPLTRLVQGGPTAFQEATVRRIDLDGQRVLTERAPIPFRELAICLGSVPAYYGVAGAAENTFNIYRLSEAQKLAQAIRALEAERARGAGPPPEVVVVGGGSTGTEVAAEVATANWSKAVGRPSPRPRVSLVAGKLPFLAGLPSGLVRHARELLARAHVRLDEGRNVVRVAARELTLEDGNVVPFDVCVWAAGVQAPDIIREIPAAHGHGGRLTVDSHLEVPGHPGVFALGDVAEFTDPKTGVIAPATAQAALAEARVAGPNLVARRLGKSLKTFRYREKGAIISLGIGEAAGSIVGWSVWGRPAALMKDAVQEGHRFSAERGGTPPGL
jgi:NADH:ubiquinone reductase (H+-translocating)